jgi:hypothetical protein
MYSAANVPVMQQTQNHATAQKLLHHAKHMFKPHCQIHGHPGSTLSQTLLGWGGILARPQLLNSHFEWFVMTAVDQKRVAARGNCTGRSLRLPPAIHLNASAM